MSFQQPTTVPSFSTDREGEDNHWRQKRHVTSARTPSPGQSKITSSYAYPRTHATTNLPTDESNTANNSATTKSSIREKLEGLINGSTGRDLPMYKDKPHYPIGRRRNVWDTVFPQGRRRRWVLLGAILFFILWWSGLFSRSTSRKSGEEIAITGRKSWWSWSTPKDDWQARREQVRQAFIASWDDYAENGWGLDIYDPVRRKGRMMVTPEGQHVPGTAGIGWIIVDGLDTAIMMNLTTRVAQARSWIKTSLDFSQLNGEVNTFETTIRVLGGLLSAHYLSTTFPDLAPQADDDRGAKGEDLYIEKAVDLADRLLGAFESKTGIPYASINLNTSKGIDSIDVGGSSSTAEAATLQLEHKYVSKLTGETFYWQKAEEVMRIIEKNKMEDGLVPIFISPYTGKFYGHNIRLGSRGDSYYEYLIKQYLQTGQREEIYKEMWDEALEGVKRHLITFSKHANFTILGEREGGLGKDLSGKMDHLVCFMPGAIALGVTGGETIEAAKKRMGAKWGRKEEENLVLAEELMKTCYGMYAVTPTGLAPEITYMVMDEEPRHWVFPEEDITWKQPRSTISFTYNDYKHGALSSWRKDYDIHAMDTHNLQRPETIESLFYMYRITKDEKYRQWGWEIFQAFQKHTQIYDSHGKVRAYTSIDNVMDIKDRTKITGPSSHESKEAYTAGGRDNLEGFWFSETLKYLYLLFSDDAMVKDEWFDLSKVVINTEAHFFPRFDIEGSKVFKTGWSRHDGTPETDDNHVHHDATNEETIPEFHNHAQDPID